MGRSDALFRALADPTRRRVFERLTRGEASVNDIAARFDVSQPAISQHLRTLRAAGLVRARREGRHAYFSATPGALKPLVDWIAHHQAFWRGRLDQLKTLLEEIE